jgi:protein ImuB
VVVVGERGETEVGGITLLRLVPDQLVRAAGRQLRLWGDAVVTDQVARAAIRVQAMLGHGAVTRPVRAGGRRPAEQALLVPFGDAGVPSRPADRPWPGQIPAPAPATVYPEPRTAWVTDSAGAAVSVTARAQLSAPPAWLSAPGQAALAITAWAGPWPVSESWWDPAQARRQARFQLVTDDGRAWLAVLQDGGWLIEASYD